MPVTATEPTLNVVERTLLLLEVSAFQALASEEVAELATKMSEVRFAAGEAIFTDGGVEGRLYIVVDGAVELAQGEITLKRAAKGAAFGVFGLLGIPAIETARAAEPTHMLVLAREDFVDAVAESPEFALGCLRSLALALQALAGRVAALERSAGARR
jgi:CRP-like cAMP-binding protein